MGRGLTHRGRGMDRAEVFEMMSTTIRVEIDIRQATEKQAETFAAIRLYPRCNEEMAALEYFIEHFTVKSIQKNVSISSIHYAILSEPKS